jgi:hypothetical protein
VGVFGDNVKVRYPSYAYPGKKQGLRLKVERGDSVLFIAFTKVQNTSFTVTKQLHGICKARNNKALQRNEGLYNQ